MHRLDEDEEFFFPFQEVWSAQWSGLKPFALKMSAAFSCALDEQL